MPLLSDWNKISSSPEYWEFSPTDRMHAKAQWFKENIAPTPEFNELNENDKVRLLSHWVNTPDEQSKPETSMIKEAGKGLLSGVMALPESIGSLLEYTSVDKSTEGVREFGKTAKDFWQRQQEKVSANVPDMTGIKNTGDFFNWASWNTMQMVGQMATTLPFMGGAAGVKEGVATGGKVLIDLIKTKPGAVSQAAKFLGEWIAPKAIDIPIGILEAGQITSGQTEAIKKGEIRKEDPLRAFAAAFIATKFESLGAEKTVNRLISGTSEATGKLIKRVVSGALATGVGEGTEEFFQQYAEQFGINPKDTASKENFMQYVNAAGAGFIGGLFMGGGSAAFNTQERQERAKKNQDFAPILGDIQKKYSSGAMSESDLRSFQDTYQDNPIIFNGINSILQKEKKAADIQNISTATNVDDAVNAFNEATKPGVTPQFKGGLLSSQAEQPEEGFIDYAKQFPDYDSFMEGISDPVTKNEIYKKYGTEIKQLRRDNPDFKTWFESVIQPISTEPTINRQAPTRSTVREAQNAKESGTQTGEGLLQKGIEGQGQTETNLQITQEPGRIATHETITPSLPPTETSEAPDLLTTHTESSIGNQASPKAKDLTTSADSFHEQGYYPDLKPEVKAEKGGEAKKVFHQSDTGELKLGKDIYGLGEGYFVSSKKLPKGFYGKKDILLSLKPETKLFDFQSWAKENNKKLRVPPEERAGIIKEATDIAKKEGYDGIEIMPDDIWVFKKDSFAATPTSPTVEKPTSPEAATVQIIKKEGISKPEIKPETETTTDLAEFGRIPSSEIQPVTPQEPSSGISPTVEKGTPKTATPEIEKFAAKKSEERTALVNLAKSFKPGDKVSFTNGNGDIVSAQVTERQTGAVGQDYRDQGKVRIISDAGTHAIDADKLIKPKEKKSHAETEYETKPEKSALLGKKTKSFTSDNKEIESRYAVFESGGLTASHDTDFKENKNYPQEIQPRDRDRKAMKLQVEGMANAINPELLGESATVTTGAPIVGKDAVVESGNGRTIALQKAYQNGKAEAYRQWLINNAEKFGLDKAKIEGMKNPILTRTRETDVDRIDFVKKANQSDVARMSPTEQARSDADMLTDSDISLFAPSEEGDITVSTNRIFIQRFTQKIGANEATGYTTESGDYTKQLVDRIRSAIFFKAYRDDNLLAMMAEDTDPNIKNILNALTAAAPEFVKARSVMANLGNIDIIPKINAAATIISKTRSEGIPVSEYVKQLGLFEQIPGVVKEIALFIDANKRSGKKLGEYFKSIGSGLKDALIDMDNMSLPGFTKDKIDANILIERAAKKLEDKYGNRQQGLFEGQREARNEVGDRRSESGERESPERTGTGKETGKISEAKSGYQLKEPSAQLTLEFKKAEPFEPVQDNAVSEKIPVTQRTRMLTTGNIAASGNMVGDVDDVASLLSHIRKSAQEVAYTIAVDKAGTVLEIHKYSKGTFNSSQVNPVEAAGRILNIPDVAKAYFVHNHPSGNLMESESDRLSTNQLGKILALKDISLDSLVIGGTRYKQFNAGTIESRRYDPKNIAPQLKNKFLPVKERFLQKTKGHEKLPQISDSETATNFIRDNYQDKDGFLLLDMQNKPIDFIEYPKGEATKTAASDIIGKIEKTNAAAIIVNSKVDVLSNVSRQKFIENLSNGLSGSIQIHDVINKGRSLNNEGLLFSFLRSKGNYSNPASEALNNLNVSEPLFKQSEGWYSQMEKFLSDKLPNSAHSEQVSALVDSWAKKGEYKQEELDWSGLKGWLSSQSGKVTKQQVLDYLDENNVQVKEVVKTSISNKTREAINNIEELKTLINSNEWANDSSGRLENKAIKIIVDNGYSNEDAQKWLREEDSSNNYDNTKFSQYQTPGGENYKELLLTLPIKDTRFDKGSQTLFKKNFSELSDVQRRMVISKLGEPKGYKSPHFDEPNILVHVRFNEHTDSDVNRVLVIQEVQADKGQEWQKLKKKIESGEATEAEKQRFEFLDKNFPYNKTSSWVMLAMRRMVRYAAENGFDKIAWTPGEIHTQRWGTERIEWKKQSDGSYLVEAKAQVGGIADNIDLEREATTRGLNPENSAKVTSRKELENTIRPALTEGQDARALSEKLWDRMQTEPSGVSMPRKEGFEGFYDKILPAEVNKFFNKKAWGNAKVGSTIIPKEEEKAWKTIDATTPEGVKQLERWGKQDVWYLPITPEMKQKALSEGMPLFKKGISEPFSKPDIALVQNAMPYADVKQNNDGTIKVTFKDGNGFTIDYIGKQEDGSVILETKYGNFYKPDPRKVAGAYLHSKKLMLLSETSGKPVFDHEFTHFLERSGYLKRDDIGALNMELKKTGIRISEEGRADLISDIIKKRDLIKNAPLKRVLQKIQDFIDMIRNLIGSRTALGVVRDVESGRIIKDRTDNIKALGAPAALYQAVEEQPLKPEGGEMIELYHGSSSEIKEISGKGRFGKGLFFSSSESAAGSHIYSDNGKIYKLEIPKDEIISAKSLFYDDKAAEIAPISKELAERLNIDEDIADDLISERKSIWDIADDIGIDPTDDLGELSWDIQALTLKAANALGYRGVRVSDEHGTSYLLNIEGYEKKLIDIDNSLPESSSQPGKAGDKISYSIEKTKEAEDYFENGEYQKDHVSILKGMFKNWNKGNITGKIDLSVLAKWIKSPDFSFEKIPALWRVYESGLDRVDATERYYNGFTETHEGKGLLTDTLKFQKDRLQEYEKLKKLLIDNDANKIVVAPVKWNKFEGTYDEYLDSAMDNLKEMGFSDQAIVAWKAYRKMAFNALEEQMKQYREQYAKMKKAGLPPPQITTIVDGKEIEVSLKTAESIMGQMADYYYPRMRQSGNYTIFAKKEGVNPERINMDDIDIPGVGPVRVNKKAEELRQQGYKVTFEKSKSLPEDVYETSKRTISLQAILQQSINNTLKNLKKNLGLHFTESTTKDGKPELILTGDYNEQYNDVFKKHGGRFHSKEKDGKEAWHFKEPKNNLKKTILSDLHAEVNNDIIEKAMSEFAYQVTMDTANVERARGFRAHMIKRGESTGIDVWKGYEEDPNKAFASYLHSLSGGLAKRDNAIEMTRAMTGTDISWQDFKKDNEGADYKDYLTMVNERRIDPATQKNAYSAGMAYMDEMLRNQEFADRAVGVLKGLAVIKYLGGRVIASSAVNLTALVTAVPASMNTYAGVPLHNSIGALGKGLNAMRTYWNAIKTGKEDSLGADLKWCMDEIYRNGWDNPQVNKEALGVLRSKIGGAWAKTIEYSMWVFGQTEKLNRVSTIAGTFLELKAMANGKGEVFNKDAAIKKAKKVSDRAHGTYGKVAYPMIAQGKGLTAHLARSFYMFSKYSHTYLQNMYDMGVKYHNYKSLAYMAVAPTVLAGLGAFPLSNVVGIALKAMLKGLTDDDDPEESFYQWAEKNLGIFGNVPRQGISGMFGVDIRGSLAISVDPPTNIIELLGAPGSVLTDIYDSSGAFIRGDFTRGLEKALPRAAGTIIQAAREGSGGVTTKRNAPLWHGDEQIKPSGYDTLLRIMSLNPAHTQKLKDKNYSEKQVDNYYKDWRAEINSKVRAFASKPTKERTKGNWLSIYEEIQEYNIQAHNRKADVPLVTSKTINMMLKKQSKPPSKKKPSANVTSINNNVKMLSLRESIRNEREKSKNYMYR